MNIQVWGLTDVGLKRTNNQDTFLIDPSLGLYVVADGMGGHRGGEVASALAVQTVRDVIAESHATEPGADIRLLLARAFKAASSRIHQVAALKEELQGMGTTMVCALFRDGRVYVANVGDSRAYLRSKYGFWQVTEDHSLLYEHLRAGMIKEEEVPTFLSKNIITRSVGFESDVVCDIVERRVEPGERYVLCSDGLSGLVSDERIVEIMDATAPDQIVPELVSEAKKNGGDDNITVLMLVASESV